MSSNTQEQNSGKDSTNVQAGRDVIFTGISYADVRQISEDVFKKNLLELQGEAQVIAQQRVDKLVADYLATLQKKDIPLDEIKDPDMQYTLFSAQRDYARMGREDLKEILVGILVERTKTIDNDMKRIVLNEAIQVAPKLTLKQLNSISVCFLIGFSIDNSINSVEGFNNYLKLKILPFCQDLAHYTSDYQHIEYAGAGAIATFKNNLCFFLRKNYSGVLSIGFDEAVIESLEFNKVQREKLFIPCLRDKKKWQISAINDQYITDVGNQLGLNEQKISELKNLQNKYLLSEKILEEELALLDSSFAGLFHIWNNVGLGQLRLTSVGISLAHANIKRTIGIDLDLSIWIQ